MKKIFILIITIIVLQSCNILRGDATKPNIESVFLYQDGKEILLSKNQSITINRDEFSIRFYNKKYNSDTREFYCAQIAAFLNLEDLKKIKVGEKKENLSCYKPASGMAAGRNGYEFLIFNKNAHHYLMYENQKNRRLNLLETKGLDNKFEFEIKGIISNKKKIEMSETQLSEFYLSILIDRNLNGIIDENELTKLTIKIK